MPSDTPSVNERLGVRWTDVLSHVLSTLIAVMVGVYISLFWVQTGLWMPTWFGRMPHRFHVWATGLLNRGAGSVGLAPLDSRWVWALLSLTMGIAVPWMVMALLGRGRPTDIGLRWPNRVGWRLTVLGYLVAMPMVVVMARSPAARSYYQTEIARDAMGHLAGVYLCVLVAEHFFFQGILLAVLRPGRRWPIVPETASVEESPRLRMLRWIGLAQPTDGSRGLRAVTRWIGLADGCFYAVLLQAALFGLAHAGKPSVEWLLSFPGGVGLGYVAYRSGSLVIPMVLHAATALTTLALMRF